jgi:hypothetical protein
MMLKSLLLYRLVILNTCGAAGLAYAWQRDLVAPVIVSDTTHISYVILALFVVGLISTFVRAAKVGAAINEWKTLNTNFRHRARQKAAKMDIKNDHINDIAKWLAYLGLLGTIIGFKIALAGSAMDDVAAIKNGIDVAIGTTIVGGILCLWTWVNLRILDTATHSYQEDVK